MLVGLEEFRCINFQGTPKYRAYSDHILLFTGAIFLKSSPNLSQSICSSYFCNAKVVISRPVAVTSVHMRNDRKKRKKDLCKLMFLCVLYKQAVTHLCVDLLNDVTHPFLTILVFPRDKLFLLKLDCF